MPDIKYDYGALIVLAVFAVIYAADQDSMTQLGAFRNKPSGPFYCRARCVASCLKMNLASNITQCVQERCSDFSDNTPCLQDDAACWQTCGNDPSPDDSMPLPVQEIKTSFDMINDVVDPYTVRIEWEPTDGINVYIIEVFPMENGFDLDGKKLLQDMTSSNSYLFKKPDFCGAYMSRIMIVNENGISIPHYRRINEWTPSSDDIDLKLNVESIKRPSLDEIKVLVDYKKPETWKNDDIIIGDSIVRAYDCSGVILGVTAFQDGKPDDDGFYWPLAFINDTGMGSMELTFPYNVLQANCKYTYKILALQSRCGSDISFDFGDHLAEVNFTINCDTVENANCDSSEPTPSVPLVAVDPSLPPSDESIYDDRPTLTLHKMKQANDENNPPALPWTAPNWDNKTVASFEKEFENKQNNHQDDEPRSTPVPPAPLADVSQETNEDITLLQKAADAGLIDNVTLPKSIEHSDSLNTSTEVVIAKVPDVIVETAGQSESDKYEALAFSKILAGSLLIAILVSILMVGLLVWYTKRRNQREREPYLLNV